MIGSILLAFFLVVALTISPVFAASRIASGEHENFSRLVVYDVGDDFFVTRVSKQNFQIGLQSTAELDLAAVFYYVPRQRILDISRVPGGLEVQLGCDCDVFVFEVARNTFAVDVVDANTVSYAIAESAYDVFASDSSGDIASITPPRKIPMIEFPVLWRSVEPASALDASMLRASPSASAEADGILGLDVSNSRFGALLETDQLQSAEGTHDALASQENFQNKTVFGSGGFEPGEIGDGLRLHSGFSYVGLGSYEDRKSDNSTQKFPQCADELREFFEVFLMNGQSPGVEVSGNQRDTLVVDDFDVLERYEHFFSLGFLDEARGYAKLFELQAWSMIAGELISLVSTAEVSEFPYISSAAGCGDGSELWVFLSGAHDPLISNEDLLALSEKFSRLPPRLRELLKVRMRERVALSESRGEVETLFENSWVLSSTRPRGVDRGSIDRAPISDPVFSDLEVLLDEKAPADRLALESTAKVLSGTGLEGEVISSLNDLLLSKDNLPGSFDLLLRMKDSDYVSEEISDGLFADFLSYMREDADEASVLGFMMSVPMSDRMRLDQDQQAALQDVLAQRITKLRTEHDLPEQPATEAELAVSEESTLEQGVAPDEEASQTSEADTGQTSLASSGNPGTDGISRFGEMLDEAETEIESVREFLRGAQ